MAGRLTTRRRLAALALAAGVLLAHGLGVNELAAQWPTLGPGAALARIEVAFVRPLQPRLQPQAPPPAAAPRPAPIPAPRLKSWRVEAAGPPASAPLLPEAAIEPAQVAALELAEPRFDDLPAASLDAFDWPPSTRLTYRLQGHWRGALEGQAQVQWVRVGAHYQVQMDVVIGLPIAPLMSRRVTSDGSLGAAGLVPRRYEERTRIGPAQPTFSKLRFDAGEVLLVNGRRAAAPPGVQDSASQFVQLAWLFNTRPELLTAGERIELPLALPRRVGNWVYQVQPEEVLATPLGPLATHALEPRPGSARAGELAVQMWIAPSLQYLPVRIRIEQGADSWIDLLIESPPMQEAVGS